MKTLLAQAAGRLPPGVLGRMRRSPDFGQIFDEFKRNDAPAVPLHSNYRNGIKSAWMHFWWPTASLLALWERAKPPVIESLVREIRVARALPMPLIELASISVALQRDFPEHLQLTGATDERLGAPVVLPRPDERELGIRANAYRSLASDVAATLSRHGLDVRGKRMLDLGCGTGYLAYAMAAHGAGDVIGVDNDPDMYGTDPGRERMIDLLAGDRADAVDLRTGDAHELPFGDGEFDVVFSSTAIEHLTDLPTAVTEVARVLRRGGLTYHGVEPWFAPRGGHSLCTLDFPWGHVRSTAEEFATYVRRFRPHEADDAVAMFATAFQSPRLTLDASRRIFAGSFHVLEWQEMPLGARDPHRCLAGRSLLDDCRRTHPSVAARDLLTATYTVVGRREGAS